MVEGQGQILTEKRCCMHVNADSPKDSIWVLTLTSNYVIGKSKGIIYILTTVPSLVTIKNRCHTILSSNTWSTEHLIYRPNNWPTDPTTDLQTQQLTYNNWPTDPTTDLADPTTDLQTQQLTYRPNNWPTDQTNDLQTKQMTYRPRNWPTNPTTDLHT